MSTRQRTRASASLIAAAALAAPAAAIITSATPASAAPVPIHDIQGAGHVSPVVGQVREVGPVIVTALGANGFWVQDPVADADPATSEALFVATPAAPTVGVGDSVNVTGTVAEVRAAASDLSTTTLTGPTVVTNSPGNPLPDATIIGAGGRVPPATVIDDDANGEVDSSGTFDAGSDGVDFYESLEGMRVQIGDAVAVSPSEATSDVWVVADNGAGAGTRTARGGLVTTAADQNPERIRLHALTGTLPTVDVGDRFAGAVPGIVDYAEGNFRVDVTAAVTAVDGGLAPETATAPPAGWLAVSSVDAGGLAATDAPARFTAFAQHIVSALAAPDVIALANVGDDSGSADDGVVSATATLDQLVAAITAAGGPTYQYRSIDPANDADGGAAGTNLRSVFLVRTDRGVGIVDRAGGSATSTTTVTTDASGAHLSSSPGRIAPADAAWAGAQKPIAIELTDDGRTLFAVAGELADQTGDDPLFGVRQPPVSASDATRDAQAQVINTFVDSLLGTDADGNVVVFAGLNDTEYSSAASTLADGVLSDVVTTLPVTERYDAIRDGNSVVLDHIFLSGNLAANTPSLDIVHTNAEFATRVAPTDSQVATIDTALAPPLSPEYVPIVPVRVLETRPNYGLVGYEGDKPAAGATVTVDVTDSDAKVPGDAKAVVLNVTGVEPALDGFVTVWPCDAPRPLASNLNLSSRTITPNLVVSKISSAGTVCLFTQNSAHLVVDVNGYMPSTTAYVPLVPDRLLDTRAGAGQTGYQGAQPGADSIVEVQVTGAGTANIPADAKAAVLNVTGVGATAAGYLTVWPCGQPRPVASNVNLTGGIITPNAVVSKIGQGGKVCLYTQSGADLVVDVSGYFPAESDYVPVVPDRVLETRTALGQVGYTGARPGPESTVELKVTGVGSSNVPADAKAVVLNVTGTDVTIDGFVTVWPCGAPRPLASNVNLVHDVDSANAVIAKIGEGGKVCIFTQNGANLVADINGYVP